MSFLVLCELFVVIMVENLGMLVLKPFAVIRVSTTSQL